MLFVPGKVYYFFANHPARFVNYTPGSHPPGSVTCVSGVSLILKPEIRGVLFRAPNLTFECRKLYFNSFVFATCTMATSHPTFSGPIHRVDQWHENAGLTENVIGSGSDVVVLL